ncbi:MAG: hypothetical protein QHH07_00585 [Sedimentisphaerales bacterium]|jgi:hypothetical protein|nr:hypothetical protein [Sedimentisphaerales bacterium]
MQVRQDDTGNASSSQPALQLPTGPAPQLPQQSDYRLTRVLAGMTQAISLASVAIGCWWFLVQDRDRQDIIVVLCLAAVFQLMALTLHLSDRT